jgi:GT2 family glycosyltransferase
MMELIRSDETIGGIGGTVYTFKDKSTRIALPQLNHFNMVEDWDRERFQLVECDFLPSSNLLMKKDVLLKVGGFTEIYDYLLEDNDFGSKVMKFGLRNVADRRTVAFHPFKSGPVSMKRSYNFYRNVFLYVLLNFHFTRWPRIAADRVHSGHRVSRSDKETAPAVKNQGLTQKLNVFVGMFFGLADVIFLSIPVMGLLLGNGNYITKYRTTL